MGKLKINGDRFAIQTKRALQGIFSLDDPAALGPARLHTRSHTSESRTRSLRRRPVNLDKRYVARAPATFEKRDLTLEKKLKALGNFCFTGLFKSFPSMCTVTEIDKKFHFAHQTLHGASDQAQERVQTLAMLCLYLQVFELTLPRAHTNQDSDDSA